MAIGTRPRRALRFRLVRPPNRFFRFCLYASVGLWFLGFVVEATFGAQPPLGIGLYTFSTLLVSALGLAWVLPPPAAGGSHDNVSHSSFLATLMQRLFDLVFPLVVCCFVGYVFGALCHDLFLQWGGFAGPTTRATLSWMDYNAETPFITYPWTRFALSWVVDNGLFNFAQIFDLPISAIHATVWWSRGVVLIYNFVIEVTLINGLINVITGRASGEIMDD